MDTAFAFIRFRWLCLPRWLRAGLIATGLTLVLAAMVTVLIVVGGRILTLLIDTVGCVPLLIVGLIVFVIIGTAEAIYKDIDPSIKKKDKG